MEPIKPTDDSIGPQVNTYVTTHNLRVGGCLGRAGPIHQVVDKRSFLDNYPGVRLWSRCKSQVPRVHKRCVRPTIKDMTLRMRYMFSGYNLRAVSSSVAEVLTSPRQHFAPINELMISIPQVGTPTIHQTSSHTC